MRGLYVTEQARVDAMARAINAAIDALERKPVQTSNFLADIFPIFVRVIDATAGEGGAISPEGKDYILTIRSYTYTITPDEGYMIADVRVNGDQLGCLDRHH